MGRRRERRLSRVGPEVSSQGPVQGTELFGPGRSLALPPTKRPNLREGSLALPLREVEVPTKLMIQPEIRRNYITR